MPTRQPFATICANRATAPAVGENALCGPDQLHGFDERLTTDIYPADFGWTPDWKHPERRLDWYHNMSSVLEAGECVRTNQLDFDDEALFLARQRLYDAARRPDEQPFMLLLSLTHPHDPFAIPKRYLDRFRQMTSICRLRAATILQTMRIRRGCAPCISWNRA